MVRRRHARSEAKGSALGALWASAGTITEKLMQLAWEGLESGNVGSEAHTFARE